MEDGLGQAPKKIPEHQAVYGRVRDAILFGELVPGQAVTIQSLTEMTGSGMTPIREAIRRLTAEGALLAMGNRRIVVPRLDEAQLDEITFARLAIEPKLAEIATDKASDEEISQLTEIDDALNAAIDEGSVERYLMHNHRFHFALYELAGSEILAGIASMLWLRMGPSLRVVCGRYGTANLPDMHDAALAALKAGDAATVADAVRRDILQGVEQVRSSLNEVMD